MDHPAAVLEHLIEYPQFQCQSLQSSTSDFSLVWTVAMCYCTAP